MKVFFDCNQVKEMATFVAQLVKEGVVFETEPYSGGWNVKLTGGF